MCTKKTLVPIMNICESWLQFDDILPVNVITCYYDVLTVNKEKENSRHALKFFTRRMLNFKKVQTQ